MKERLEQIEIDIALIKKDISTIGSSEPNLPKWLRNSAIGVFTAMVMQIMTMVWWAAELNTTVKYIEREQKINTDFRVDWPKQHQDLVVMIRELQVDSKNTSYMVKEIKDKLRNTK